MVGVGMQQQGIKFRQQGSESYQVSTVISRLAFEKDSN